MLTLLGEGVADTKLDGSGDGPDFGEVIRTPTEGDRGFDGFVERALILEKDASSRRARIGIGAAISEATKVGVGEGVDELEGVIEGGFGLGGGSVRGTAKGERRVRRG